MSDETQRRIVSAIADPGSIVGRRLHPSWGEGNDGYAPEAETIAEWGARAVLALTPAHPAPTEPRDMRPVDLRLHDDGCGYPDECTCAAPAPTEVKL